MPMYVCKYIYIYIHLHLSKVNNSLVTHKNNKILLKNIDIENTKIKDHSSNGFLQELNTTKQNIVRRFPGRIWITGIAMPDLQNIISLNLYQNATVLHGKISLDMQAQACHMYANNARKNRQNLFYYYYY